jgi:hypothetical protein
MNRNILFGFYSYFIMNKILQKYQTKKLAMNCTAGIHASTTSFIWLIGSITSSSYMAPLIKLNTGGYFLFDMVYLIKNRKMNLLHGMYIYHHISGLYYMSLSPVKFLWPTVMGIAELSNIPTYVVYYYLKTKPNSRELKLSQNVQKYWFGFHRIISSTILTYFELIDPIKRKMLRPVIPLYFFGLVWSLNMFKQ